MNRGVAVVVGVILLIAMFFGVKMMLDPSGPAPKNDVAADMDQVMCWGYFEVESGVANLYPTQFGIAMSVSAENKTVNAGDVLVQVDDNLAQLTFKKAEAAVTAAALQLDDAKLLPELYKLQAKQQQSAINAIDSEINKLEKERKRQIDLLKQDNQPAEKIKTVNELYDVGRDMLNEKKSAEVAKLKVIELQNADTKIKLAQADLLAKQLQRDEAKEALRHYKVLAPSKGTVLRVHVRKGETLGPNPRAPAVEFMPDAPIIVRAEIMQEWGRFVKEGQSVVIEDDIYNGPKWEGTVKSLSKWYANTRNPVIEPFRYNDVRTLECIIDVKDPSPLARYGQRIRAKIKIDPKAP